MYSTYKYYNVYVALTHWLVNGDSFHGLLTVRGAICSSV